MKRHALVSVLLLPAVALAQPDPGQPPAPYPPPPPAPYPAPYPAPAPAPTPAPYPPAPGPAPLGYQQPMPYQPPPTSARRGFTFEANVGVGYARVSQDSPQDVTTGGGVAALPPLAAVTLNSDAALAGLDLGVGGWINPHLAVTARIAGGQVKFDQLGTTGGTPVNLFFGPSAQYWFDDHIWAGGGLGFATFRQVGDGSSNNDGSNGFGLDLRGGYSFGQPTSNHAFNVSLEVNPCFYSENGVSGSVTSFAILAGYQYL